METEDSVASCLLFKVLQLVENYTAGCGALQLHALSSPVGGELGFQSRDSLKWKCEWASPRRRSQEALTFLERKEDLNSCLAFPVFVSGSQFILASNVSFDGHVIMFSHML